MSCEPPVRQRSRSSRISTVRSWGTCSSVPSCSIRRSPGPQGSASRQSRGIGGDLVRNGLAAAAEAGFGFVVVIGAPGYYERFGFRKASAFRLGNEFGVDDPFMALELSAGALSDAAGIVRYRPEFNMFEE
jgi:hypothetical protein